MSMGGSRRRTGVPGWTRVCSVGLILALGGAGCSRGPHQSAEPAMTLEVAAGSATIVGGGATNQVSSQQGIGVGYRVTVPDGGLAVLRLAPGRTFQIGPGVALITTPDTVQLEQGGAVGLVTSQGTIDSPGVTVQGSYGVFRVDSGPVTRVAVYRGEAKVSVPTGSITVPAYRQVTVAGGGLPAVPSPLQLTQDGDVWDHQFLQPAIDLDSQLASFGNGLEAQLGESSASAVFDAVIPSATDVAYVAPFFSQPRSEVLIGWVIASDIAAATKGNVDSLFQTVMGLHALGESWGVVAMEYGVGADVVFSGLQDALNRLRISLTSPTPRFVAEPTPSPVHPAPTPSPTKSGPRLPTVTPNTPTPTPPSLLGSLLDPVTSLLGQILNLLLPPPATPSPSPTP